MSKKTILFFLAFLFFYFSRSAFATLSINEIMYDLDGPDIDWVEVANPSGPDVDLSTMKLLISNSSSNHAINNSSGSSILHAGDYAVIVASSSLSNYTSKWGTTGNIFTSSFSLPNDTGQIQINAGDKTQPITSVTYNSSQGASGDGNSLQLISGSWVPATPTPGSTNITSSSSNISEPIPIGGGAIVYTNFSPTDSSTSKNKIAKTEVDVPIKTNIVAKEYAFTRIPKAFIATALGHNKEELYYGKYFWNFGDGDSKEIKDDDLHELSKISHTYFYTGTYHVTLEYYSNYYSSTPDATDNLTVNVVPADISISRVGDEKDFFVELSNNTIYDLDLSGWVLSSSTKSFMLPKNTMIESKKKLMFSPQITGLSFAEKDSLKLFTPQNEVAYSYANPITPVVVAEVATKDNTKVIEPLPIVKVATITSNPTSTKENTSFIPATNLQANAISSDVANVSSNNTYFPIITFSIFLAGSAGVVYFIRRKKIVSKEGEDFKILDE